MGPGEKKIAAVLVVVLIALVAVYIGTQPGGRARGAAMGPAGPGAPPAGGGGGGVEELGSPGAKVEIIALVPVANPCHAATIAELRKAYKRYPDDIHLRIIEFMGPESTTWRNQLGVTCATVAINGEWSFDLDGRRVVFQKMEGGTYTPADLGRVIEAKIREAE